MLDRPRQLQFLKEGLGRYSDAKDTIEYFEESLYSMVGQALEAKEWRHFQPKRSRGQIDLGRGRGTAPRALSMWVEGSVVARPEIADRRVFVFLSVMWNPPTNLGAKVVAASSASFERGAVPLADQPHRDRQIELAKFRGADRRLVMRLDDNADPWATLPTLLDALDEALAPLAPLPVQEAGQAGRE